MTRRRTGWGEKEPVAEPRRAPELSSSRRVLRRLIEVVAEPIEPQERLDRIVSLIASNLVAEVCSVYAQRAGDVLELFATEGLAAEAVHLTRLRVGEGLVGTIAATGDIINTNDASSHANFAFRPETGEEIYHSFLGVPIVRGGKIAGVLVVQNSAAKLYGEDDVDALKVIASILAEMFSSGGIVDRSRYTDVETVGREPRRLEGLHLVDGIGIGRAWLHAPRIEVERILAEDPDTEIERIEKAIKGLQASVDRMLAKDDLGNGEHLEILEAYRMFAHDGGWFKRIKEAISTGVTAEAAVRRVQEDTQLRLGQASDPYIRERLLDLDDLANRLLMQLAGRDPAMEARAMPENSIIIARSLSAADLIEYDRSKIRGIVLEEGSGTAHVTVVARAFDVPMLGRVERAMSVIESGDQIALDGDNSQAFLRPTEDVVDAFRHSVRTRTKRRQMFDALRKVPSRTRDGVHVSLSINAAFLVDLAELEASGAEGIGLYRTELAFMARPDFPNPEVQTGYYSNVLDQAGDRPVVFRTLDVGSDKQIPYWRMPEEENPAMGWRALRMLLDRPSILRAQLRAMLHAASGRNLHLMFPMVAEVSEFERARQLLDLEIKRARGRNIPPPASLKVGAMMEVPALYWQLSSLLPKVDFISVGSNDLIQFLFACDRGSAMLSDRYDVLSPPALSFLRALVLKCGEAGVRLSVCGEMASRPIEAMALIGLGVRHLSLSPAQIGPVKAMVRSLDASTFSNYLLRQLDLPDHSLRNSLADYARDREVNLNP